MERVVYKEMFEKEDSFWWHVVVRAITRDMLARYLGNKKKYKILDAGSGTGGMFAALAPFGDIWAIDESSDAVLYAQKRGQAYVTQGKVESMPFPGDFFDLIVCSDVLYHKDVKDVSLVIQEFYRVLKPGGVLFVREAAYQWLYSSHDTMVWTRHRFTKKELENLIVNQKFQVLRSTYINFFLFPFAVFIRFFEKIFPKNEHTLFSSGKFLNAICAKIFNLERVFLKFLNFPFGLSIICIAKKR